MWIDTHCHLNAGEFDADLAAVASDARRSGVDRIVIPGVERANFATVRTLAHRTHRGRRVRARHPSALHAARDRRRSARAARRDEESLDDPRFVGIGEIGLDYFVPTLDDARQQFFYNEQLKLARTFGLLVICHVRKSQDKMLKGLRVHDIHCGIAHAFNGSFQQAEAFQGMWLGFSGNLTFERARQIRRLAAGLPLEAIVLQTDAPDIVPSWR